MPIAPFILLSLLLHGWVGWRIAPPLGAIFPWAEALTWAVLVTSGSLMPLAFMARRM